MAHNRRDVTIFVVLVGIDGLPHRATSGAH